ncbi:oligoribonuclease [Fictibacillus sp. Mic-4]|uniref:DHH family phosphoesterase n=1 Tax=Fictibacillus sp. Mic-4 TaxID=3132826 RepID=UPI003CED1D6D
MIKLFSHNDLDGKSCGLIAKIAFGDDNVDASYCSHDTINRRVREFLDNPEYNGLPIYITDIAVNEELAARLDERYKNGGEVYLFDHHVTALQFNEYDWGHVKEVYEDGRKTAATSLLYDYFIQNGRIEEKEPLREYVELVRLYDTWEWSETNNLKAKHLNELFFMFSSEHFEQTMMERIRTEETFELTDLEQTLLHLEEEKIERYIISKERQMVETWEAYVNDDNEGQYRIGIVHAERYHSELGNVLNTENPHLDLIVILNIGRKQVGFRTIHDHVDVSAFAGQFGGGGHPKASGCPLTEKTFERFVVPAFQLMPRKRDPRDNQYNVKENRFGTLFMNHQKEMSNIRPLENGTWELIHNSIPIGSFPTFAEAEHYAKRHFSVTLLYDDKYLQFLSATYKVAEEELRENYAKVMERVAHEEKASFHHE